MNRRFTAILCAALMLCGCGRADGSEASVTEAFPESEQVRVWIPEGHMELVTRMCEEFTKLRSDKRYALVLSEVKDSDITSKALKGREAADVLFFPSEQLAELAQAGALDEADAAVISCGEYALNASADRGTVCAYPCAADVRLLYYDRSLITDSEAESLDVILAKQLARDKVNFAADITDSGYLSSFFLAAGCRPDEPQSFASQSAQLAAELVEALAEHENAVPDMDARDIRTGFAHRRIAAAVSDPQSAAAIASSLGSDFGAAKLPTITFPDGSTAQPVAAVSFLLVGVNSGSKVKQTAHELAQWLSNKDNQLLRLKELGFIPTDESIVRDVELMEKYPAVEAAHRQLDYCVPLTSGKQEAALCDACEELGGDIIEGDKDSVRERLESLAEELR